MKNAQGSVFLLDVGKEQPQPARTGNSERKEYHDAKIPKSEGCASIIRGNYYFRGATIYNEQV